MTKSSKKKAVGAVVVVILTAIALYLNALSNGFVYDDYDQVLYNEYLRDLKYLPHIFLTSTRTFFEAGGLSGYYRPMMNFLFMMEYHLFGLSPLGFHLVNIILNACNAALVFFIARRFWGELGGCEGAAWGGRYEGDGRAGLVFSFVAAMLFVAHPVHVEAVVWVSALPELLFALFLLLSFVLYITAEGSLRRYLLSAFCFFLAALSKETAVIFPVLIFSYDYLSRKRFSLSSLMRYFPYLIAGIAYMGLRYKALGSLLLSTHSDMERYTWLENVAPLLLKYIGKLFLPVGLSANYQYELVTSLAEVRSLIAILLLAAIALLIALFRKHRLILVSLIWFFVTLMPAFYLPALTLTYFADRYLYLPSMGFVLFLSYVLIKVAGLQGGRAVLKGAAIAICLAFFLFFAVTTVARNRVWQSDYTLWSDTVKVSPKSAVAHHNLGVVYSADKETIGLAIDEFKETVMLSQKSDAAYFNLGTLYMRTGRLEESASAYEAALKINPRATDTHLNLGVVYLNLGRQGEAEREFKVVLRFDPGNRAARNYLKRFGLK